VATGALLRAATVSRAIRGAAASLTAISISVTAGGEAWVVALTFAAGFSL